MGRSLVDYDFRGTYKPCSQDQSPYPKDKSVYPKEGCPWYSICDLPQKNPSQKPIRPQKGRMPC